MLGRFLDCSGFGAELAGPGFSFISVGGDFRFLGFMSGQEKDVCPGGIFMGAFFVKATLELWWC